MAHILKDSFCRSNTFNNTDDTSQHSGPEFQNRRRLRAMIEAGVARTFGVAEPELRKATRGPQQVAFARQVAMYLAHVGCGLSLTEVGVVFSRDRTTVAYACSVIEDRRDDETFDYVLELLERIALSNILPRNDKQMLTSKGPLA